MSTLELFLLAFVDDKICAKCLAKMDSDYICVKCGFNGKELLDQADKEGICWEMEL